MNDLMKIDIEHLTQDEDFRKAVVEILLLCYLLNTPTEFPTYRERVTKEVMENLSDVKWMTRVWTTYGFVDIEDGENRDYHSVWNFCLPSGKVRVYIDIGDSIPLLYCEVKDGETYSLTSAHEANIRFKIKYGLYIQELLKCYYE